MNCMEADAKSDIDRDRQRYPFCVVWTPIPVLTWLFPFIGHMGIAMSSGVIRDFAGPYFVGEDDMAFGKPTRYWRLDPQRAAGGVSGWDRAVAEASEVYSHRMHNLFCDNCHSHTARALNLMAYDGSISWNMVKLAALMLVKGRFTGFCGFLKTWVPFFMLVGAVLVFLWVTHVF